MLLNYKHTNNSFLQYSILLLLCGLFLSHLATLFAIEHSVYQEKLSHIISSSLFFLFFFLFFYSNFVNNQKSINLLFYVIPVALIFIESYILFKESGFLPEQLIEHALKIMLPLMGVVVLKKGELTNNTLLILKILVAFTFFGHGLFALGIHFVPKNFVSMTTAILQLSNSNAERFLFLIGILDVLAAIGIFFNGVIQKSAFIYMILWGLITAFARIVYGSMVSTDGMDFLYYVSNTIYRIPNGLIPLYLMNAISKGRIIN
jgi:hypothetical protein